MGVGSGANKSVNSTLETAVVFASTHLLEAKITLIQKKGSELFDVATPYKGIWQQTKKINRVTMVHRAFSLNGICSIGQVHQW